MQSVVDAFSVEAVDPVRQIATSAQISWKKAQNATYHLFTIGVSTIGSSDAIKSEGGVISDWNTYLYSDESAYLQSLGWERELNLPEGGVTKALAEVRLDNTSGRFTPRTMGGNSELFTAQVPRRPMIINAGFNVGGVNQTVPQFVGITTKVPELDNHEKSVSLRGADFLDFLNNRFVDHTTMFTGQRTDQIIETILTDLGYATSQYELDVGVQRVGFGVLPSGEQFGSILQKLVRAENGHLYQDEEGKIHFENRGHWSTYPHFNVQRVITTAQVLGQKVPTDDKIVNVVEVHGHPRSIKSEQLIWTWSGAASATAVIPAGAELTVWATLSDPAWTITNPTGNAGAGTSSFTFVDALSVDATSSVYLRNIDKFPQSAKLIFHNNSSSDLTLSALTLWGTPATADTEIYYREERGSSVTAYDERVLVIDNEYVQEQGWAEALARMILDDFGDIGALQKITIRAMPELQMGDLISWQGHYWYVYGIRAQIEPGIGFVQELSLLQRSTGNVFYFTVGVSQIASAARIA